MKKKYSSIRGEIKTGDVLFTAHPDSGMVRGVTNSDYSHAGVFVWFGYRLLVFENVGERGAFFPIPFSKRMKISKKTGDVLFLGRVSKDHLREPDITDVAITDRVWSKVGNPYPSRWSLISGLFALRRKSRIKRWCNENVEEVLGVVYNSRDLHRATNPGDLAEKCGEIINVVF